MNTKNWKDRELNRLLMERFGYSMSESVCEEVHPGMSHQQYLEESELEEMHCGSGKRDEELDEMHCGSGNRDQELEENAFVLAADAARDAGKKEFEFPKGSGKMHPVTIKKDIPE